jgi:hypothetical protein
VKEIRFLASAMLLFGERISPRDALSESDRPPFMWNLSVVLPMNKDQLFVVLAGTETSYVAFMTM